MLRDSIQFRFSLIWRKTESYCLKIVCSSVSAFSYISTRSCSCLRIWSTLISSTIHQWRRKKVNFTSAWVRSASVFRVANVFLQGVKTSIRPSQKLMIHVALIVSSTEFSRGYLVSRPNMIEAALGGLAGEPSRRSNLIPTTKKKGYIPRHVRNWSFNTYK